MADRRVRIGIRAPRQGLAALAGEPARFLAGLVEGAAARGTVTFCIDVAAGDHSWVRRLLHRLAAREGADWTLTVDGLEPPADHQPILTTVAPARPPQAGWLLRRSRGQMRWLLLGLTLAAVPLQLLRALVRPVWRLLWANGLSAMPGLLRAAALAWRDPHVAAAAIAPMLANAGWRPVRAFGETLRGWPLAPDPETTCPGAPPPTDGWLLLAADEPAGLQLPGRRIVLFGDATPFEFPFHWDAADWAPGGYLDAWLARSRATLAGADGVLTLSRHVAGRHVTRLFGVAPERVASEWTAASDRRALLPVRPPGRRPTPESRSAAGGLLRDHAIAMGLTYLTGFPFEDVRYVMVAAADRPAANIALVVEAVRLLLRRDYFDIKLFIAAPVTSRALRQALDAAELRFDALVLPDLPPEALAALYHCAAVTVHPCLNGGDVGALPFGESVSVGVPCLMARGPSSLELLGEAPALAPFLFDPCDAAALAERIRVIALDPAAALEVQEPVRQDLARRSWGEVAERCAALVAGRAVGAAVPP